MKSDKAEDVKEGSKGKPGKDSGEDRMVAKAARKASMKAKMLHHFLKEKDD